MAKSFFGISYRQLSMPKDYQRLSHDQRVKIHHSCSCKQSVVHTRWRRKYLTIDMFKFTDVTASHVLYWWLFDGYCFSLCLSLCVCNVNIAISTFACLLGFFQNHIFSNSHLLILFFYTINKLCKNLTKIW